MSEQFVSRFGTDLSDMIRLMVVQGGSESTYMSRASSFDLFCYEQHPACDELTEALALSWVNRNTTSAATIHYRATFLRGFACYLNRIGKPAFVIPDKYFCSRSFFVPYLFSDKELTDLFAAIDRFQCPGNPFLPIVLSTYFRLTYTCGLRPGEGRNLMRSDVHLDSGEVYIRCSKKNKSRVVVMSDDMLALAKKYAVLLNANDPDGELFFPQKNGRPFSAVQMQKRFQHFFVTAHPHLHAEFVPSVRVYDLRHRFATATLNRWLDEKQDIQARLPYLQTYMGHTALSATAYYIHLLPENLVKSSGVDWAGLSKVYPNEELWRE